MEELLGPFNETYISKDLAFNILSKADVKDALTFNLTITNKNVLYEQIKRQMDNEEIWLFWVKRDLEPIFNPQWTIKTVLWEVAFVERWNVETKEFEMVKVPKWKVYYLWLRLYFLEIEYEVLTKFKFEISSTQKPTLHHFWVRKSETEVFYMVDVRKFDNYSKFGQIVLKVKEFPYTETKDRRYKPFFQFCEQICNVYLSNDVVNETEILWDIFLGIFNIIEEFVRPSYFFNPSAKKRVQTFPRYGLNGLITVANCISCGEETTKVEKTNPKMAFCDKECQLSFYQEEKNNKELGFLRK